MRVRGIAIQQVLLGAALLLALLWNLARAAEIDQLRLETGPTGTRAELRLDAVADYQVLSLANPDRLVLDLPGSALRRGVPSFVLWRAKGRSLENECVPVPTECELGMVGIATMVSKAARGGLRR